MRIHTALRKVQAVELRVGSHHFVQRSAAPEDAAKLIDALDIEPPPLILGHMA